MADLRIVDAPVLLQESITDDVKMPTGGIGNYTIRLGDLVWYVVAKEQLASKSYVDTSSKGVQDKLDSHIVNKENPHQVTKEQVGLGNVDNTADVDKPVSNATKSAINTATAGLADKAYVDDEINALLGDLKTGELVGSKVFATRVAIGLDTTLTDGAYAFVVNDTDENNGLYQKVGGSWQYQNWNPLKASKQYTDATASALINYNEIIKNVLSYKFANLVNPSETTAGFIDDTGSLNTTANTALFVTGFIPVIADKNIQLWAKNGQAAWGNVVAFDINKKYIGSIALPSEAWSSGITTLKIPTLVNGVKPYFIRASNNVNYHNANDVYIGLSDNNPREVVIYDASKLAVLNPNIVDNAKNTTEFVKATNLLQPNHVGTVGYLTGGLEPFTQGEYAKNFLTTAWIDIPSDTKYLVIVGNIYSYTVATQSDVYLSRIESDTDAVNVTTLVDLSKSTKTTTPTRIRVSFRRLGADTNALQSETWSQCGIYIARSSIGSALASLYVHNYDFDTNYHLPSDSVYLNNLLDIAHNKGYPISNWATGFKTGYLGSNNALIESGDYYDVWATTPHLVCEPDAKYVVKGSKYYAVAFLDYDKKFISTYYAVNDEQTFKTPSNACYFRVTIVNGSKNDAAIYQVPNDFDADLPVVHDTQIAILRNDIIVPTNSTLKGKTWVAMGDSITASSVSYANQLANRHGANLVKHARDGARVHRDTAESTWLVLAEEYQNITVTSDIITIAGGTNDPMQEGQVGAFTDRTINTLYGALHVLLSGLRSKFPDARIGYISPIPRDDMRYIEGDMASFPYVRTKAIREVCAYYGVPVWIGALEFGANPADSADFKNKYMPDGLHPNQVGHTWYANRVEQFILNLVK